MDGLTQCHNTKIHGTVEVMTPPTHTHTHTHPGRTHTSWLPRILRLTAGVPTGWQHPAAVASLNGGVEGKLPRRDGGVQT